MGRDRLRDLNGKSPARPRAQRFRIVDVVAGGANEVDGIEFDVAELYAEAADVRLGAVVHIEDISPERGGYDVIAAATAETNRSSPGEVLVGGQISVSAAVIVGSSIDQA